MTGTDCAWCGKSISPGPEGWQSGPDQETECPGAEPGRHDDGEPHVPASDIVVSREGASTRTADELVAVFVLDVSDILAETWGDDFPGTFSASMLRGMDADREFCRNVSGWVEDEDDAAYLSDMVPPWEGYLGDAGHEVTWDDGYVIWRTGSGRTGSGEES